jgi:hypothetical protein
VLSDIATLSREAPQTNANQANIQPVFEVYANASCPGLRHRKGAERIRGRGRSQVACASADPLSKQTINGKMYSA